MIPRHPYFRTRKDEQHEAAYAKLAREARDFLARKAADAAKLKDRRLLAA
ncbi:MAG: hypothetical protein J0I99_00655 [Devosia sp.]|nr:hypothetical protein [Devosia sp.]MBN9314227.1 hypothetical protein [Devosia sp.]